MKKYPIVCPSCNGKGRIPEATMSSNTTKVCPACGGSGKVIVEED